MSQDKPVLEQIKEVIASGNKVGVPLSTVIKMGFTAQQWTEIVAALSALDRQGWISVEGRLPMNSETVLFVCNRGRTLGHYSANEWWDSREESGWPPASGVTHWMPLPEAPK